MKLILQLYLTFFKGGRGRGRVKLMLRKVLIFVKAFWHKIDIKDFLRVELSKT